MALYLLRRVVQTILILLGVAAITFVLLYCLPADPAVQLAGRSATPATVAAIRKELGLDQPLIFQFWRYLTGSDDRPEWPTRVPVTPGKPEARVEGERMTATWIGHATMLIQTRGLNILTDPIWSAPAGPFGLGPRRVAAPGVRFADLPKIDLVLVSHNHWDHLDKATLKRLWRRDRPVIVTSLGFALARGRGAPILATKLQWPTRNDIDAPLLTGAALFGTGWGLVGLCPGPAIVNLASLSLPVIVFVIAMAVGMFGFDLWRERTSMRIAPTAASATDV